MSALQDLEAERMVLGSVLVENEAMNALAGTINARHFSDARHLALWEAMFALYERSQPIDLVTVKNELADAIDRAGGVAYLAGLMDGVPRITNPDQWGRIVLDKARRRGLVALGRRLQAEAESEEHTTDDILERHQEALGRIAAARHETVRTLKAVLPQALKQLEEFAHSPTGLVGIPCGLPDIDNLIGGWREGALYIVAARPSFGKSAFCSQVAVHAASRQRKVLFFGMEMPDVDVTERMLLSEAAVNKWDELRSRTGYEQRTAKAWDKIGRATGRLAAHGERVWFDGREQPTVAQIRAASRQHAARHGLDLVIVDYLQRCALPPGKERWEAVGDVALGLKTLARALRVPVIAACQITAEAHERRPTMADLAQARQVISQEADVIAFLHPEDLSAWKEQAYPKVKFIVDKHRAGATADIPLSFERATLRFMCMGEEAQSA